jgi:hypothetical protein
MRTTVDMPDAIVRRAKAKAAKRGIPFRQFVTKRLKTKSSELAVILDTNALSAIAEGDAAALDAVGRAERVAIPVIVLGEYRFERLRFGY